MASARRWRLALIGAAALILGAGVPSSEAADPVPVRLILNWKFEGPNAPFFLAQDRGYFAAHGVKIQLDAGEGSSAPPSRIASGAYDAGFGDITSMIEFGAKNPQVPLRTVSTRVPGLRPVRTSDTSRPADKSRARVASALLTRQLTP